MPASQPLSARVAIRRKIRARRAKVALWHLQGYGPLQIREMFVETGVPISVSTIKLDLKALDEEWKKQGIERTDRIKREIIQVLRRHRMTCDAAYELSRAPEVITTTKTYMDENGEEVSETTSREKPQEAGDPRWQAELRENTKQLATLVGLDEITIHNDHGEGYSPDVARALEEISEKIAGDGGGTVPGFATIPVVDAEVIKSHVEGNGEQPAIEHDTKEEVDIDDDAKAGQGPDMEGDGEGGTV